MYSTHFYIFFYKYFFNIFDIFLYIFFRFHTNTGCDERRASFVRVDISTNVKLGTLSKNCKNKLFFSFGFGGGW